MLSFKHYNLLSEKVLSIGFNPEHEKFREHHRQEIHDLIHKSYVAAGGYGGEESGSKEESKKIHDDISNSSIKAVKRNGKISALSLYKKQHGRKSIASASDGTSQGKTDYRMIKHEDNKMKRAWGEVSGAPEAILRKMKVPVVPNKHAHELLGKTVDLSDDGEHYSRTIGKEKHTKVIMGHPKKA